VPSNNTEDMETNKPLLYLLGQTINLAKLKMLAKFKENGLDLSMEQFVMLHFINEKEDLTQQDLANHFFRDKSLILRQTNILMDLRYVARMQDKTDKRKKNLILTKKGYDVLEFAKKLSDNVSVELLTGVTPEELVHFKNVITKIQQNSGQLDHPSNC
jgi:DNA-binding MarR family transcriptional regulator